MYAHQHAEPGDAGEFGDLYERYQARLVRYCSKRLRGAGDAEDAAHEALLRALVAWSRLDRSVDAWPWLATIAARVCADMRRRSARTVVDPPPDEPVADVHDLAVARLRASIIDDAIDCLPARYRNPLILKEFAGWSYRDIARLEGTSVASVRSNIMRSRRSLGARVESIARARGQWPLPAVVPGVADRLRARVRSWRHALVRFADPAMVMTGLALAMQPTLVGAVPLGAVAMAVVGGTGHASGPAATAVTAQPSSAYGPPPTTSLAAREIVRQGPTRVKEASEHLRTTARQTLTGISTPPPNQGLGVGATVAVEAGPEALFVRAEVRAKTPAGDHRVWTDPNVACRKDAQRRQACDAASEALRSLPER